MPSRSGMLFRYVSATRCVRSEVPTTVLPWLSSIVSHTRMSSCFIRPAESSTTCGSASKGTAPGYM